MLKPTEAVRYQIACKRSLVTAEEESLKHFPWIIPYVKYFSTPLPHAPYLARKAPQQLRLVLACLQLFPALTVVSHGRTVAKYFRWKEAKACSKSLNDVIRDLAYSWCPYIICILPSVSPLLWFACLLLFACILYFNPAKIPINLF